DQDYASPEKTRWLFKGVRLHVPPPPLSARALRTFSRQARWRKVAWHVPAAAWPHHPALHRLEDESSLVPARAGQDPSGSSSGRVRDRQHRARPYLDRYYSKLLCRG